MPGNTAAVSKRMADDEFMAMLHGSEDDAPDEGAAPQQYAHAASGAVEALVEERERLEDLEEIQKAAQAAVAALGAQHPGAALLHVEIPQASFQAFECPEAEDASQNGRETDRAASLLGATAPDQAPPEHVPQLLTMGFDEGAARAAGRPEKANFELAPPGSDSEVPADTDGGIASPDQLDTKACEVCFSSGASTGHANPQPAHMIVTSCLRRPAASFV